MFASIDITTTPPSLGKYSWRKL